MLKYKPQSAIGGINASVQRDKKGTGVFYLDRGVLIRKIDIMPRRARSIQGGLIYHVLNRANVRMSLFEKEEDYAAFECVVEEAQPYKDSRPLFFPWHSDSRSTRLTIVLRNGFHITPRTDL